MTGGAPIWSRNLSLIAKRAPEPSWAVNFPPLRQTCVSPRIPPRLRPGPPAGSVRGRKDRNWAVRRNSLQCIPAVRDSRAPGVFGPAVLAGVGRTHGGISPPEDTLGPPGRLPPPHPPHL